jgi:acetylornithine/succinyldiaminopimelate/putrescine aminotransferase
MAVCKTIFDVIERDNLLENARKLGEHAASRIKQNAKVMEQVADVRGRGLFLGIEMKQPPKGLVEKSLEKGVVINVTADKVVRFAPPLNISREDMDLGIDRLFDAVLSLAS